MMFTKANRDINSLNPVSKQACELFLKKCKEVGLNVLITETLRTQERQNYLYCQGRTVAQATAKGISKEFAAKYCNPNANIVTWTLSSNHKNGMAWDICKNVKGHEYDDPSFFKKAGEIAKQLGIEWGGDWKEQDTPHFQVNKNWKPPISKPVSPEWQIKALNNVINVLNLDRAYWTPDKLKDPITIGEVMGLLNKII